MSLHSIRAVARLKSFRLLRLSPLAFVLLLLSAPSLFAQGGTDYTGTGGIHTIQGRIYFPSGRRTDQSVKVRLESMNTGNLTVFADAYGTFGFRNLVGGSYTIAIEASEFYEGVRESVFIDDGGNQIGRTVARVITVPIHLQFKREAREKLGVLNASLANVPKKALDLYYKALETAPSDAKKAVELLNNALAIYSEFPLALSELGVQYLRLNQPGKASEALSSAVRLSPEDTEARLNLGIALLNQGEFQRAEEELRHTLKKNEQLATAHMYLGMTLLKLNKHDEAEREFVRATGLPGGEYLAQAYKYLGGLYWRKGELRQAADALEKYVKLSPKAPDAERIRNTIKEFRSKKN
jgi:Flp pilus assembly protein TadD